MKLKNHFNLLLAITLMFSIYSCSGNKNNNQTSTNGQDSVIEKECEAYLINTLDDPSSYQRISVSLVDTIYKLQDLEDNLDIYYREAYQIEKDLSPKSEILEKQNKRDSVLKLIESIKANPARNEILHYVYTLRYRAKNKMGALVKGASVIYYTPTEKEGSKFFIYLNE
jgi:hypothetical protein